MTTTTITGTTTCPTWCRADHAADMQRRREMAAEVDRQLGVPPVKGCWSTAICCTRLRSGGCRCAPDPPSNRPPCA